MGVYLEHSWDNWNHNRMTQLSFVFLNRDYAINKYYKYVWKRIGGYVNTYFVWILKMVLGSLEDD